MKGRVLYVQYTNPAGYPPLQRSSRILADEGWSVRFLGTHMEGTSNLRFPPHDRISVERMSVPPQDWRQKVHYLRYMGWVLVRVLKWRPDWVYLSDPLATPVGVALTLLSDIPVLYHEHDTPQERDVDSLFRRGVLSARRLLARRAEICVLPNQRRGDLLVRQTERTGPTFCAWNVPALEELPAYKEGKAPKKDLPEEEPFLIHYHGSIGPSLVPVTLLEALEDLPERVQLQVFGYESGGENYTERLRTQAKALGIQHRVHLCGPVQHRTLLEHAQRAHLGLSLMPMQSDNINMRWMVGASNKSFEYLASKLPVLVSDLAAWRDMFVEPGYGRACDPNDPEDIAEAIRVLMQDRDSLRQMGRAGQERIRNEWNFETEFEPVRHRMNRQVE